MSSIPTNSHENRIEDDKYSSEHGQFAFENGSSVKTDKIPSNRNQLPEIEPRTKSLETGITCRAKVAPTMNIRDAGN